MSASLANFFSSVPALQAILSCKWQQNDTLCFALPGKEDDFLCFWRGDPPLLFRESPLWPEESMPPLGMGTRLCRPPDSVPKESVLFGLRATGSLFAAADSSPVAFSNPVCVPALLPETPQLDGTWNLCLLATGVL